MSHQNQQGSITELQKNLDQAMEYIDLLENCQCERNLKLLDVPEQLGKGTEMIPFLVKLLKTDQADIEKAHRLGAQKNASQTRGIIIII